MLTGAGQAVTPSGRLGSAGSTGSTGVLTHPQLGVVRYTLTEVPDDPDGQVAVTIDLMRQYANEDSTAPNIRIDTNRAGYSGDDLQDVWDYLNRGTGKRGMGFVADETTAQSVDQPPGTWRPIVEALIRPVDQVVLPNPQGDCDDFSMYGAAHLLARGISCAFVTLAADPKEPGVYSHVYLVAYPQTGPYAGKRVPMDLSHGPYLGWEAKNMFGRRAEWGLKLRVAEWLMLGSLLISVFILKEIYRQGRNK